MKTGFVDSWFYFLMSRTQYLFPSKSKQRHYFRFFIKLVCLLLAYEFSAYLWWKICFGVGIQEYWGCLHLPLVLGWGQYKVWWPQRPFGGWKTLLQHLFSPKPLMIILLRNSSDVFTNLFSCFFPRILLSLSIWKKNTSYWSTTFFSVCQ